MTDIELRAGVSRQVISPPPGVYLIGYGDRSKGNTAIHDDLTATALVLAMGSTRLALVAVDILCLNEFIVDRVRAALPPGLDVLLCCSHTHSGPVAYADERSPRVNQLYIDGLVEKIIEAIQEAADDAQPARFSFARSHADIAVNRREHTADGKVIIGENPDGAVDRTVGVLGVFATSGERLATLVNFACHGTVLGPDNLLVSADWIGAMRQRVEADLGGLCLFIQGATADLNPRMGWESDRAWQLVDEQGGRVAEAVLAAASGPQTELVSKPIDIIRREVWLPFEAPVESPKPPTVYRKRLLSMAGLPAVLWPLSDWLLNRRYPWRSRLTPGAGDLEGVWSVPLRLNAVRIGELAFVSLGAEVFTEIGMQVKAISPAAHTLFASVSNGCIGYLPTTAAYAEGGYEVDVAPYAYRFPSRLDARSEQITIDAIQEAFDVLWHGDARRPST